MRKADALPSVKVRVRANPIVHYTIKFTVNRHQPASSPVRMEAIAHCNNGQALFYVSAQRPR